MSRACDWVKQQLSRSADTPLLEHERAALYKHLNNCASCRTRENESRLVTEFAARANYSNSDPFSDRRIIQAALIGRMPRNPKVQFAHRRTVWALVGGVAALILFLAFGVASPPKATVSTSFQVVENNPSIMSAHRRTMPITHLFNDAKVFEAFGDQIFGRRGSQIQISPAWSKQKVITLNAGKIVIHAAKRQPGSSLVVETPALRVSVVGTRFSVETAQSGDTVRVIEGKVAVHKRDKDVTVLLTAGQELTSTEFTSIAATVADINQDRKMMGLPITKLTSATTPIAQTKQQVATRLRKTDAGRINTSEALLAMTAIKEVRLQEAQGHIEAARQGGQNDAAQVPDLLAKLARAYRQQRRFDDAADTFERILNQYPHTNQAHHALIALGRLELENRHHPQKALGRFNRYLSTQPGGFLTNEALLGKIQALLATGQIKHAISAATSALTRIGDGPLAFQVLLLRAKGHQAGGQCDQAIKDYQTIITRQPGGRLAKLAKAGMGKCEQ